MRALRHPKPLRWGLAAAASILAGCATRAPLYQPESVHGLAGVPVSLGNAPAPDSQARVHWKFGDGTEADGAAVSHAWARAGTFLITEQVDDASGSRTATFTVEVARRGPLLAVPPQVAKAFVFERFFNRLNAFTSLMERLVTSRGVDDAISRASALTGFDPRHLSEVEAAGIDPDKGLAWLTFAEEPNTAYLLVGIYDEARAEQTVRKALGKLGAVFAPGPSGWTRATVSPQIEVLYRLDRGYLAVRIPSASSDAPAAAAYFTSCPDTGLLSDPGITAARARLHGDDVEVLIRHPAEGLHLAGGLGRLSSGLEMGWAQIALGTDVIAAELDVMTRESDRPVWKALFDSSQVPTLAQRAPRGASVYASFSGDLPSLTRAMAGSLPNLSWAGLDPGQLAGELGRSGAAVGYFDAGEFLRNLIATGKLAPRGDLITELALRSGSLASTVVPVALQALGGPSSQRTLPGGRTRIDFTVEGHPAAAVLAPEAVLFSWGTRRFEAVTAEPNPDSEQAALQALLPPEAFEPGHAALYGDVAGVVEQLESTGPVPGTSPGELLQAELAARLVTAQLAGYQDLWVVLGPSPDGLQGKAQLRLRAPSP